MIRLPMPLLMKKSVVSNSARLALKGGLLVCTLGVSACSSFGGVLSYQEVKPWERDVLAQDGMQPVLDAMDQTVDDHIYFSREASTGGSGVQGGGCGCN